MLATSFDVDSVSNSVFHGINNPAFGAQGVGFQSLNSLLSNNVAQSVESGEVDEMHFNRVTDNYQRTINN